MNNVGYKTKVVFNWSRIAKYRTTKMYYFKTEQEAVDFADAAKAAGVNATVENIPEITWADADAAKAEVTKAAKMLDEGEDVFTVKDFLIYGEG